MDAFKAGSWSCLLWAPQSMTMSVILQTATQNCTHEENSPKGTVPSHHRPNQVGYRVPVSGHGLLTGDCSGSVWNGIVALAGITRVRVSGSTYCDHASCVDVYCTRQERLVSTMRTIEPTSTLTLCMKRLNCDLAKTANPAKYPEMSQHYYRERKQV